MVNSIKLPPETIEAIKRNREKQAEQRRQDAVTRHIRQREAHNAFIGYLCVLSFLAGLCVGALLIGG